MSSPHAAVAVGTPIRRLTNTEYANTLQDLLSLPVLDRGLPPEEEVEGFKNNAAALTFSPVMAEKHLLTAEDLSKQAVQRLSSLVPCAAQASDACARQFVGAFGQRAWRRPLTSEEIEGVMATFAVGKAQGGFGAGVQLALQALLVSPQFLYRIEEGEPVPGSASQRRPTPWEMASRLSYLLWGSMPDADLFKAAETGALRVPKQIEAQVQRMMTAPRAKTAALELATQWLQLHNVAFIQKSATAFPRFGAEIAGLLRRELDLFLDDALWGDKGDLVNLFTSRDSFIDAKLAAHYGVAGGPAPAGAELVRFAFAPERRAGLLTLGGLLALLAGPEHSSPTLRGAFVRERLLCQKPPPPPPMVDNVLKPSARPATTRERVNQHQSDPNCAACHVLIDPVGFGLEKFDAVGRYRETENGLPVDDSGEVAHSPMGKFKGAAELGAKMAQDSEVARCVATQVHRYALGRLETAADGPTLDAMAGHLRAGGKLRDLFVLIATSPSFLYLGAPAGARGRASSVKARAIGLFLWVALGAAPALFAAPIPTKAANAATEVVVWVAVDPREPAPTTAALERAIGAYAAAADTRASFGWRSFSRGEVLQAPPGADLPRARAYVWIDLRVEGEAQLYFLDVRTSQAAIRRFPRKPEQTEVTVEQLGLAFCTLLDAASAGETIGGDATSVRQELAAEAASSRRISPALPVLDASGRALSPAAVEPRRVLFVLTYTAGWLSHRAQPFHGPGLAASWRLGATSGWHVQIEGHRAFSVEYAAPALLTTRLDVWSARLALAWRGEATQRLRVGGGVGAGADWVGTRTSPEPGSGFAAIDRGQSFEPVARAFACASYALRAGVGLYAQAALDLELADLALAVRDGGRVRVILDAWPVRPAFLLGVVFY